MAGLLMKQRTFLSVLQMGFQPPISCHFVYFVVTTPSADLTANKNRKHL